jgi:predicted outer membrane repeat protein
MARPVTLAGYVVALLAAWTAPVAARTLLVPATYPSIAAAAVAAAYGDTISIACGTYFERNIAIPSGVTVRSVTGDPSCVTVDATSLGRVFLCSGVDATTRFEGLTIRGGRVASSSPSAGGGGMLLVAGSSPQIRDCVFENNVATSGRGGGLNCYESSPAVLSCTFRQNAAVDGGGVYCDHSEAVFSSCSFVADSVAWVGGGLYAKLGGVTVAGCSFTGNKSGIYAGGLICSGISSPEVADCVFSGNEGFYGGGMACVLGASPAITDTRFSSNSAGNGGGIFCGDTVTAPTLTDCLFELNEAGAGGGADIRDGALPRFLRCTFWQNQAGSFGGAASCLDDANATWTNCTFVSNSSAGVGAALRSVNSSPVLDRCIFAFQTSGLLISCLTSTYGMPQLNCCDSFGNAGGDWVGTCVESQAGVNGNFSADPLFCDLEAGDLRLKSDSPCLPGQHPEGYDCGLIGAFGEGCGVSATRPVSWGAVKSLFR